MRHGFRIFASLVRNDEDGVLPSNHHSGAAPDDETMAKLTLTIASGGNIRTTTLKAIPEDAYRKVIAGM
jgi:hypothetical protein